MPTKSITVTLVPIKWTLVVTTKDSVTGNPVSGVAIYLDKTVPVPHTLRGNTDANGQLTISNLSAGTYYGKAEKSGYQTATFTVTLG